MAGPWEDYQKAGFPSGPWKDYSADNQNKPSFLDKADAAVEGYGNAVSAGTLPYLQAAGEKVTNVLFPQGGREGSDAELAAKGFKVENADQNYSDLVQAYQNRRDQLAKDMPDPYYGGEGAGLLQGLVGVGGGAGKGLIKVGKKVYEFAESPPGRTLERVAIPVAAYLGLKKGSE